jgi:hypothetical protein
MPRSDAALDASETACDHASITGEEVGIAASGGRVLLHQAVQRGLLRAMALVVERNATRRALGLPADGLHDGLPRR